jgi:hypothetical protein
LANTLSTPLTPPITFRSILTYGAHRFLIFLNLHPTILLNDTAISLPHLNIQGNADQGPQVQALTEDEIGRNQK